MIGGGEGVKTWIELRSLKKKSRPKKQSPWGKRDSKEALITAFFWSGRAQGGG